MLYPAELRAPRFSPSILTTYRLLSIFFLWFDRTVVKTKYFFTLIGLFVGSFDALTNLVNHSELIVAFRLWTAVPHRPLHHGVCSDPTETRAEHMTQIVNREIRYASFFQSRPPCSLDAAYWLARTPGTWKHVHAFRALFLLPLLENIASQPAQ